MKDTRESIFPEAEAVKLRRVNTRRAVASLSVDRAGETRDWLKIKPPEHRQRQAEQVRAARAKRK
jgi:hypothetical protein